MKFGNCASRMNSRVVYLHKKFKKQLNIEELVEKESPACDMPPRQHEDKCNMSPNHLHNKEFQLSGVITTTTAQSQLIDTIICSSSRIVPNEVIINASRKTISPAPSFGLPCSGVPPTTLPSPQPSMPLSLVNNKLPPLHLSPIPASTTDFCISSASGSSSTSSLSNSNPSTPISCTLPASPTSLRLEVPESSNTVEDVVPPSTATSVNGKYVCTYCNLACSKPSVLQKHIRAHTNERPFPCHSCGFSFKTRSNLYKHCRSRTHANRVMGEASSGASIPDEHTSSAVSPPITLVTPPVSHAINTSVAHKPYKPRFHTTVARVSPKEASPPACVLMTRTNDLTSSNDVSIVPDDQDAKQQIAPPAHDALPCKVVDLRDSGCNDNEQPLNLSYKMRKRSLTVDGSCDYGATTHDACAIPLDDTLQNATSKAPTSKSLIKQLLLKNLGTDNMQCSHCKMIFQTVTELELHKFRSCKASDQSSAKQTRSNSVNVASILTQNKCSSEPTSQPYHYLSSNTASLPGVFPLASPGPFLGNTRLVDSGRSFHFDSEMEPKRSLSTSPTTNSMLSSSNHIRNLHTTSITTNPKKTSIKLFGGAVKISDTSSSTSNSLAIQGTADSNRSLILSTNTSLKGTGTLNGNHNRLVRSGLQSGGTVLTNQSTNEINTAASRLKLCSSPNQKSAFSVVTHSTPSSTLMSTVGSYGSGLMDFSQKAAKMLTPNLKQPTLALSGLTPIVTVSIGSVSSSSNTIIGSNSMQYSAIDLSPNASNTLPPQIIQPQYSDRNLYNPMNVLFNGKVVRYVPGMPGPVVAQDDILHSTQNNEMLGIKSQPERYVPPRKASFISRPDDHQNNTTPQSLNCTATTNANNHTSTSLTITTTTSPSPTSDSSCRFSRPNSLALKPSTPASLKQHHGLTPTVFNQILISPDTPRVAKKYAHQFLHGNYFSYLGLKSSTKPVYCTLSKPQPFYVPHFKRLSMYSEWRQQDTKQDKLFVSAYNSKCRMQGYTVAPTRTTEDLILVHSSYKAPNSGKSSSEVQYCNESSDNALDGTVKANPNYAGGYESNDEYQYVRGRGRGRYVCDQCGIRCKKPSMLKKHIRTHSNDRPYTCGHCNFSFKTKGNLTKHLKSKAHTKNSESGSSTHLSGTQSSDTDTDDSGMDSSDDSVSTRREEHEAAYGLLSLSQNPTTVIGGHRVPSENFTLTSTSTTTLIPEPHVDYTVNSNSIMTNVGPTTYISQAHNVVNDLGSKASTDRISISCIDRTSTETLPYAKLVETLPFTNVNYSTSKRPLTYPYTSTTNFHDTVSDDKHSNRTTVTTTPSVVESSAMTVESDSVVAAGCSDIKKRKLMYSVCEARTSKVLKSELYSSTCSSDTSSCAEDGDDEEDVPKVATAPTLSQGNAIDLRVSTYENHVTPISGSEPMTATCIKSVRLNGSHEPSIVSTLPEFLQNKQVKLKLAEYDNSAMETLADIATRQVKLDRNTTLAKSVASEYLKLATKQEQLHTPHTIMQPSNSTHHSTALTRCNNGNIVTNKCGNGAGGASSNGKDLVNDLMNQPEGSKCCAICSKSFSKPSQLRLHINIHYLERPFRCDSCSVSFRTKGHLQKHERSAGHHNKLSSPSFSSSEPRPFKCLDCNSAFRIHGHLAKHLRSKMHIMKLECQAKIPFGLYAELERSNSLLTEINTTDGEQCLQSLKILAQRIFAKDPKKLRQVTIMDGSATHRPISINEHAI